MQTGKSHRVAVVVGSLRAGSISRKVARALMQHAPQSLTCELLEIGDLPMYNDDLEQPEAPAAWSQFRSRVKQADALLFVTPEYNRSVPGCLKNALDVGSRPENVNAFDGKPAAVVSVTPYQLGAFGANHALRQTFVFLNMPVMQQPEAYIAKAGELFDAADGLQDAKAAARFDKFMRAFASWIKAVQGGGARDFEAFLKGRQEIASAYVRGDSAPLAAVVARRDPATFYGPAGSVETGAQSVADSYARGAKTFGEDSSTRLEILQSGASGELGFWTGLQHASVTDEKAGKTEMTLRVTEVFRFEDGDFKLVHRHADPAKP